MSTPSDSMTLRNDVEYLNARRGELATRVGITYVRADPETIVATMPVEGNRQPYGLLHGGASVVLAETIGSALAGLATGFSKTAVGVEINATHHRGTTSGLVTGTATLLSISRSMAGIGIEVRDDAGVLLCTSRLSCFLRERRAPSPPA